MKVSFDGVVSGLNRYIDNEIYKGLNDLQELLARVVVGRFNQNTNAMREKLIGNNIVKTLGYVDEDGMIEIDLLLNDIKKEIERKGSICVEIPLIGKLTFHAEDVNAIRNEIAGRM